MLQKITLQIGGEERTFQQIVTARMCRTAYEARMAYIRAYEESKEVITQEIMDGLVSWLVEAFGAQFTSEQFWDGYSGSFLEIRAMMDEVVTSISDVVIEYPKRRAPEAK